MAAVRVRQPVALLDPTTNAHVVPSPGRVYDENDPLVQAHRWAFATDDELLAEQSAGPVESVAIEDATAAPGSKRATRRK